MVFDHDNQCGTAIYVVSEQRRFFIEGGREDEITTKKHNITVWRYEKKEGEEENEKDI